MPHAAVNPKQRDRAKSLRRRMTRAETLLWRHLKAGHLDGLSFLRQVPMGAYIVDFVCHAARLVLELDGETHDFDERLHNDRLRDAWLASRGFVVKRFTNDDVFTNLEGVLIVIREIASNRIRTTPPSLSLPHKGGGNPQTTAERSASPKKASGAAR